MINPAVIVKILSFKDKSGKRFIEANSETGIMEVQLESGDIINVHVSSNIKEYNNRLAEFLNYKTNSIISSNEIKKASLDIVFNLDKIDTDLLNQYINEFKTIGINNNGVYKKLNDNTAKNEAITRIATDMITQKRKIKSTSIVRIPIAIGDNGYYNSRFIILKKDQKSELNFVTNGLYSFAQTSNHIPIEISAIKNVNGEFKGYFKILTAKTITANQIKFLIKHSIRTIGEMLSRNKKPFMLKIIKQSTSNIIPMEYGNIAKEINIIEGLNRSLKDNSLLDQSKYDRYIYLLEELLYLMELNKSNYKFFRASLPLVVDEKYMQQSIDTSGVASKDLSPLQNLITSINLLNFNTENPNVKAKISSIVKNELTNIYKGINNMKIYSVIHFIAPNIFDEIDTWGFPINNIDTNKFTLSYKDTLNLYDLVDSLKYT